MASGFAWVDFAEKDRQQMLHLLQLFREHGARDELGLGIIRDAFADYFFPGTSTIQTRARYMLFIPWIYRDLERREVQPGEVAQQLRKAEVRLIDALLKGGEGRGVIGRESRERLQRLISSIYWAGLGAWGIRLFPGSQDQYHRSLGHYYLRRRHRSPREDGEPVDGSAPVNWHPGIPDPPQGWSDRISFSLTRKEAEYLRERVVVRHGKSLLRLLLDWPEEIWVDFPWLHPIVPELPERLHADLIHARNFSEAMHGAALLYNLMLAEKRQEAELVEMYQEAMMEWADLIAPRWVELQDWYGHLDGFWSSLARQLARIPPRTTGFVADWLCLLFRQAFPGQISGDGEARQLIYQREVELKQTRARLQNPRALELWLGASSAFQIDYRWPVVQRIVNDIVAGLQAGDESNAEPE